jgi:hypothetical protein
MTFESQSPGKPLVSIQKRSTKVNVAVVAGVLVFLFLAVVCVLRIAGKADRGEPVMEAPAVSP